MYYVRLESSQSLVVHHYALVELVYTVCTHSRHWYRTVLRGLTSPYGDDAWVDGAGLGVIQASSSSWIGGRGGAGASAPVA